MDERNHLEGLVQILTQVESIKSDVAFSEENEVMSIAALIANSLTICDSNGQVLSGKEAFEHATRTARILQEYLHRRKPHLTP